MKKLLGIMIQNIYTIVLTIILAVLAVGYYAGSQSLDTLQTVKDRGKLICGINNGLPGFGNIDIGLEPPEKIAGFDVDFCRVIAAAIFGYQIEETSTRIDDYIEFQPMGVEERLNKVESGEIDVLIRNTTWNVGRDIERNIAFGPVIFLDSQGVLIHKELVYKDLSIKDFFEKEINLKDVKGLPICVLDETTSIENIDRIENTHNTNRTTQKQSDTPLGPLITGVGEDNFETNKEIFDHIYRDKGCIMTTDKSQLLSFLSTLSEEEQIEYKIIPEDFLTKEPLAPVVIGNDKRWHDVVTYAIYATIQASELDINRSNLDQKKDNANLEMKRFLGMDDGEIEYHIGEKLELDKEFVQNIIRYVGNYDEIYEANLINIIPERGYNKVWNKGGLLISPPFATPKALGICHHLKIHYHINCTWPFIGSPE